MPLIGLIAPGAVCRAVVLSADFADPGAKP
jgi:hypothetical protein